MADIYARLKTTPNGPGPQHKKEGINEFEFTEGKDGKLNVRDVDVKAELELIKQQQQQILQRLNEPIETELTGSIVEDYLIAENLLVTAGSVNFAEPTTNNLNYDSMTIMVVPDTPHKFSADVQWQSSFGASKGYGNDVYIDLKENYNRAISKRFSIKAKERRTRIMNKDTSDHTYNVVVTMFGGSSNEF